jgi:hypothetical protein
MMSALRLATVIIAAAVAGATTAPPSTAAQSPGGVSEVNDEVVTALRRTVEAQASRIEAQASEIAALRVGSAAAGQQPTAATSRRHLASKVSPDFRAATAKKNNRARTPDFEMEHLNRMGELRDLIMNEGLPGEEARRHLQDAPSCSNFAEEGYGGFMPQVLGTHACGHLAMSTWGDFNHVCHSQFCDSVAGAGNGSNLCVMAGMCDAMCGFCGNGPVGELALGQNVTVEVTEEDSPNNPRYRSLSATAGRTYRVRAFPDLEAVPAVRSMLLVVRNPDGKPIRRAVSNTGNPIRASAEFVDRTPAELEAEPRDTEMGCIGDTHIDILFKPTKTGVYTIGLSQATDAAFTRLETMSPAEFSLQWRGTFPPFPPDPYVYDLAATGSLSVFGAAKNGSLTLLVDDATDTLPPLPMIEQIAMDELQSAEHGLDFPSYVWDPSAHPCTWGGEYVGLNPHCCLRNDEAGNLQAASISSVDTNQWWHLHQGAVHTGDFLGTIPNSIENLTYLRNLHVGPSQISGTIPAGLANLPLNRLFIDNTMMWGHLPQVPNTLQYFAFRGLGYISGTIPDNLGSVENLRYMWLRSADRLSGTLPHQCGQTSLQFSVVSSVEPISGTIHDLPHVNHASALQDPNFCHMTKVVGLWAHAHSSLSGTLSENWACAGPGKTTSFNSMTSFAMWNAEMGGTLPQCMFDGMERVTQYYVPDNRFTGKIPNLNLSTVLEYSRLEKNDFTQFPDALGPNQLSFQANDNPQLIAPGSQVAQLIASAPKLIDFSIEVDSTTAAVLNRGGGVTGPIPDLGWSPLHPKLPLDCRFGELCAFELLLIIGLDYFPMRSIGVDFVVHMSASPKELNDQIVGINHLISAQQRNGSSHQWDGTNWHAADYQALVNQGRRRAQQATGDQPQEDLSGMGEIDVGDPTSAGATGHLGEHVESLNLTLQVLMHDSDDGTMGVVIPPDWFTQTGTYDFRIYATTNYCVANTSGVLETLPPGSCVSDPRCAGRCDHHKPQLYELYDKSLWFINMHPIVCHDALAFPNAAGSTCQCPPGSAPTKPCEKGDSFCECVPCVTFGSTHYSDDGAECKQCGLREVSNTDSTGCQCGNQFYNSSNGKITCHDQDVKAGIFETNDAYKVARDQEYSSVCIECPACVDCTVVNTPPRIRAGFHMSDSDITSGVWFQANGTALEKNVIRCRPESLVDEAIMDERLDALSRLRSNGTLPEAVRWSPTNDLAEYPDEEVQCLGTPYVDGRFVSTNHGGVMCALGHTGTLCGKCLEGFGKKDENQCVACGAALRLESILTTLSFITVAVLVVGVLMMLLSYCVGDVYGEHLGQFKGHVSELDADLSSLLLTKQDPQQAKHVNPLYSDGSSDDEVDLHLRALFQRVDANHSGHIDRDEVAEMARSLGHHMTKSELDASMSLMDPSGDGLVSFEEFAAWIKNRNADDGGGLFPVVQVSISTLFKTSQDLFFSIGSMSIQPIKLFISYWQIAAQLGPVLHFSFPPQMAALIKVFKPFVAAIHGFVALECAGLTGGFYVVWLVEVFVIPATLWGCVGVYYLVRRRTVGVKEAVAQSTDDALFVLFCVYPMMSNKFFKMLNCRDLSNGQLVIATDYSVDCTDTEHEFYKVIAIVMIAGFSFGVPFGLMLVMAQVQRQRHKEYDTSEWNYIARRIATQLGENDATVVKDALIDISLGNVYGTLVNAYRPGYFRWECFDMIRKLLLVGMLTVVQQGSVLQICTGLATSFVFFAAHIRALPFRHIEDNVLKATTEAHLFIILIVVLALKSGLENDVVDESFYDTICTALFFIFVVLAAIFCIAHKWRVVVRHTIDAADDQVRSPKLTVGCSQSSLHTNNRPVPRCCPRRTPSACRRLSRGTGSGATRLRIEYFSRNTLRRLKTRSGPTITCSSPTVWRRKRLLPRSCTRSCHR